MYNYNPYYMNNMNNQPNYYQPRPQPMQQAPGLQGKSVDSLEAVKAADIPFDRNHKLLSICR